MAMFPCSAGGHRYTGPQRSAYIACVNGSETERTKLRLCEAHFGGLRMTLADYGHEAGDETYDVPAGEVRELRCRAHGEVALDWTLFVALYPLKAEPVNLWGPLCEECLADVRQIARTGL